MTAPVLAAWLMVLWVALWGAITPANVLAGVAVSVALLSLARVPPASDRAGAVAVRPLRAVHFAGYFLLKLVQANLVLAWEIVTPRDRINTGIVAVDLDRLGDTLVTLVANTITLTPGTVSLEVRERDDSARTLYIHVLHLRDVDQVRRDVRRIARLAAAAFGTRDDIARLRSAPA